MNRGALVSEVDLILDALGGELSAEDRRGGWSGGSQEAMRVFFSKLRLDLLGSVDVAARPEYVSIVRGLDHWGVTSGPLFEQCANISYLIAKSPWWRRLLFER
jgi:hypothetical protein